MVANCSMAMALGLLLAGLVAAGAAPIQEPAEIDRTAFVSGKALIMEAEFTDKASERLLAVHTADGKKVKVHFDRPTQLEGLRTGMDVHIPGSWRTQPRLAKEGLTRGALSASADSVNAESAGTPMFHAAGIIRASGAEIRGPTVQTTGGDVPGAGAGGVSAEAVPGRRVVLSTNTPTSGDVTVLVIPIGVTAGALATCKGVGRPLTSIADVRKTIFSELNPIGPTLGATYTKCSYGTSRLTNATSLVSEVVNLPCSGASNGVPWSFEKCDYDDFTGYSDAAMAVLRTRGVPIDNYRHKIFLLPPGACNFVGLGYVGCGDDFCYSWIGANFWTSHQAMAHEVGHNLFMDHAGAWDGTAFNEYADDSGAMGYCCADRCFNTPHAWQLGWISVQQFNATNLRPGQTVGLTLASQAVSSRSGIRIVPTWAPGAEPIFASLRTAARGDVNLSPRFAGKLNVYTSLISGAQDPKKTTFVTAIPVNGSWTSPQTGIVLRHLRLNQLGESIVRVCRIAGKETLLSCQSKIDWDCNGLVGLADPACAALLKKGGGANAAPSPPPPTPPVRSPPPPKPPVRSPPPPKPPVRAPPKAPVRRPARKDGKQ